MDQGVITNPNGLVVASDADDKCPHRKIIELYHEILPANPRIREWTTARQKQLKTRWLEDRERQNLEYWRRFFELIAQHCPFLTGQREGRNGQPFLPGLEWMVKRENFVKIREGRYVENAA